MSVRGHAGVAFLKLPGSVQRASLHAVGKYAPWEPGFDHRAPPAGALLRPGPPDFVGVGVQKAGTTWWYDLITKHPGVYHHDPFHKERHFFGRLFNHEFSESDASEYHGWFPRPAGAITGEWTPDYLHQHWVVPMLRAAAPDAKLMVLIRDPVERFRSGLDHVRQRGEKLTPTLITDAFTRGLYGAQLARLEATFPAEQIAVLQYEACIDDPSGCLADTFRFLGLDDSFVPEDFNRSINPTKRPLHLRDSTRQYLIESYQDDLRLLAASRPELDLDRWPSFTRNATERSGW